MYHSFSFSLRKTRTIFPPPIRNAAPKILHEVFHSFSHLSFIKCKFHHGEGSRNSSKTWIWWEKDYPSGCFNCYTKYSWGIKSKPMHWYYKKGEMTPTWALLKMAGSSNRKDKRKLKEMEAPRNPAHEHPNKKPSASKAELLLWKLRLLKGTCQRQIGKSGRK